MITLTKNGNAVKFLFEDSQHYLMGDGEIQVPVNSLSLIIDESEFVTFKKASSDDIFVSFDPADSNLSTKDGVIDFYKNNMVGSTGGGSGSGVTSGEVESMISEALEDYPTNEDIEDTLEDYYTSTEVDAGFASIQDEIDEKEEVIAASLNDLNDRVDDKAETTAVTALNSSLTAHTADTGIHTTTAEKEVWNAKQTALTAGTGIDITNNVISVTGGTGGGVSSAQVQTMIDASISGKTDDTDFTAHTANTTAHTTSQEKAAWDAKANMVTLAQAEYDALVSAGTVDSGTCYIISDATAFDPATKQDVLSAGTGIEISSANVISVSGMQETLVSGTNIKTINNESILGSGNITIQGGGGSGATYSAGTNIEIDTANTINCTLPIVKGQFVSSSSEGSCYGIRLGVTGVTSNESSFCGRACVIEGGNSRAGDSNNGWAHAEGWNNNAWANYSHAEGSNNKAYGNSSHVEGHNNDMGAYRDAVDAAHVEGRYNKVNNPAEHASGQYNKSLSASTTWGDSGNTLFSVGNGTSTANTHNAFEIRQNGDIYCSNGTSDVKLQDYLQVKVVKISQSDYDALVQGGTVQSDTLYIITNVVS